MNRVGAFQKSSTEGSENVDNLDAEEELRIFELSILERNSLKEALIFSGAEG